MGQGAFRAAGVIAAAFGLSGCLEGVGADSIVSRLAAPVAQQTPDADADTAAFAGTRTDYDNELSAESTVIQGLAARRSVLPHGSAYHQVAVAVLAANARAAESELRAARLRAEAASKNWLPTLGPTVSLTSLGDVVAGIVIDQVIFDNGRKKGERAYAKADVEVAAVKLAQDTNDRAATALDLYIDAAEARESAALDATTLEDMARFEYIMSERVRGGVSDMSDLNVIRQKLGEIRARLAANREAAGTAIAELNAMSVRPLGDVRGVSDVPVRAGLAQPLQVTLADAEKTRAIAAASVERAGQLPGVGLSGTVGGNSGATLTAGGAPLGFGTGARLRAVEEAKVSAGRQVAQANEDANRALRKLEGRIAAKERQVTEARGLTAQAKQNLDLFQQQYAAGQRQVMDVVGVYETFAARQQAEVAVKYETQRLRLEMARILGVLADGDQI